VRIGLVADVPDDAVFGRVEHVVQRDGQFHRAQIRGQVAAGLRHGVEHVGPQLGGERCSWRLSSCRSAAGSLTVFSNSNIAGL
jgi:hypothetical protein